MVSVPILFISQSAGGEVWGACIARGRQLVESSERSVQQLTEAVHVNTSFVIDVAGSMTDQTVSIDEIGRSMNEIAQISSTAAASSEEIAAVADELHHFVDDLAGGVNNLAPLVRYRPVIAE